MQTSVDELLMEFGIGSLPEFYTFESKLTGKSVEIKTLPDDIIVNGKLHRIVRNELGEIPKWAKPNTTNKEYMRITPEYGLFSITSPKYILYTFLNVRIDSEHRICIKRKSVKPEYTDITNIEYDVKLNSKATTKETRRVYKRSILIRGIAVNDEEDTQSKENMVWRGILYRCSVHNTYQAYIGAELDKRWMSAHEFSKWYNSNIYRLSEDSVLQVDKDIISARKIYGPDTCIVVPHYINAYFIGAKNHLNRLIENKGNIKSVKKESTTERYVTVSIFKTKKKVRLGPFKTIEEAHQAWADFKNKQLQEVVIPYFIEDVFEEDREHPMVLKVIEALRNYKFI